MVLDLILLRTCILVVFLDICLFCIVYNVEQHFFNNFHWCWIFAVHLLLFFLWNSILCYILNHFKSFLTISIQYSTFSTRCLPTFFLSCMVFPIVHYFRICQCFYFYFKIYFHLLHVSSNVFPQNILTSNNYSRLFPTLQNFQIIFVSASNENSLISIFMFQPYIF